MSRYLSLLLLCSIAAACAREPQTDAADAGLDDNSATDTIAAAPADSAELRQGADSVAARLVAAINAGDAAAVARLSLLPGLEPDTAAARVAIFGFRHHFGGQPVARAKLTASDAGSPGHLEYALGAADGRRKPVVVYYEPQVGAFRAYDELLLYFPRAQRLVPAVVEAIRQRDSVRLGRLFTPDDVDYPPALAAEVIREYARRFDLATLGWRYQGLEAERRAPEPPDVHRRFAYVVTGTKDGRPVEHRVLLMHGDGLLGWDDPLVPDPPMP